MASPIEEEAIGTSSSAQPDRQTNAAALPPTISASGSTTGNYEHENLDELEAGEADSLYGGDSAFGTTESDTTSIASSIYAGYIENGRRYQTVREGEYHLPSDEKQFDSMDNWHLVHMILDSQQKNPLFHSPLSDKAQNILDVGTGTGIWARDVADKFPSTFVQGVDLFPPPEIWMPPNCKMEVDDVLKIWNWPNKWDLVHVRGLMGAFSDEQWRLFYKQAYNNIVPGGYIEQVEWNCGFACDDGTLPQDSHLTKWGPMFLRAAENAGKKLDTLDTMRARIEAAGFVNIREKVYKVPLGEWTKNPILREAGRFNKRHLEEGIEGYAMYLLTKFGDPQPWTPEEVQVLLAQIRKELNDPRYHVYEVVRRVWGQRPLETSASKPEVEVENVPQ